MWFKAKDILPIALLVISASAAGYLSGELTKNVILASELPDNVVCTPDPLLHRIHENWVCYILEE